HGDAGWRWQELNYKRNLQKVLLDPKKEERPIVFERPPNRSAELILFVVEFVTERIRRSQRAVAIEEEAFAVKVVGSGLGNCVDETRIGAADFRCRARADHLKFSDGRLRKEEHRFVAATLVALQAIIEVCAIDRDV